MGGATRESVTSRLASSRASDGFSALGAGYEHSMGNESGRVFPGSGRCRAGAKPGGAQLARERLEHFERRGRCFSQRGGGTLLLLRFITLNTVPRRPLSLEFSDTKGCGKP